MTRKIIVAIAVALGFPVFLLPSQTNQTAQAEASGKPAAMDATAVDKAVRDECERVLSRHGIKNSINRATGRYRITPVRPENVGKEEMLAFVCGIDVFPEDFIKRSGLKQVVFCSVISGGNSIGSSGGVAYEDTIYLNVKCSGEKKLFTGIIYHELFHIADSEYANPQWTRLNYRGFQYLGPNSSTSKSRFRSAFASNYAMYDEREDRAETFASMMMDYKAFEARAQKDPVLKKKGEFIQKTVKEYSPDMDEKFWESISEGNYETRRAAFVERAKTNHQRVQEGKPPLEGGYRREK